MLKKLFIIFITLIIPFNLYSTDYKIERNYDADDFSIEVEKKIKEALDSTLVIYAKVDDALINNIQIRINQNNIIDDIYTLKSQISYKDKILDINYTYYEKDETILLKNLEKFLYNFLNYELYILFENENIHKLNYSNNINSFRNIDKYFNIGEYVLLEDKNNNSELAVIESIYNDYCSIDYLYKKNSLLNKTIYKGPLNEINLGSSYDFYNNIIEINLDYFYLKNIISFFHLTNFGVGFNYYYNLLNYSAFFSTDLAMKIEFPLSKINLDSLLFNNISIYNKSKIGLLFDDEMTLHSQFDIGLKKYISSKFNFSIGYKIDSNEKSYYNYNINLGYVF